MIQNVTTKYFMDIVLIRDSIYAKHNISVWL